MVIMVALMVTESLARGHATGGDCARRNNLTRASETERHDWQLSTEDTDTRRINVCFILVVWVLTIKVLTVRLLVLGTSA